MLRLSPSLLQGPLSSLRRVKDDVREVAAGTECGVSVEGFRDWEVSSRRAHNRGCCRRCCC